MRAPGYLLPFFIWLGIVLYLSFSPLKGWPRPGLMEKLYLDKLIHLFMYSVMSLLLLWGVHRMQNRQLQRRTAWLLVACCAAIGLIIELLQPVLTLYRSYEIPDMLANVIGAALGYAVLYWRLVAPRLRVQ